MSDDNNPHGEEPGHDRTDFHSGEFKQTLFLVLVAAIVIVALIILRTFSTISQNLIPIIAAITLAYLIAHYKFLIFLSEYERAVIFRFGKVNRVGGPGWAFTLPPTETFTIVDLRTKTIDIPKQDIITKDNIELQIDTVVYLKVGKDRESVINSVIEIDDYVKASKLFVLGILRAEAGKLTLNELIARVDDLNTNLKKALERIAKKWGVTVEEAIIEDIDIPSTVLEAMHEQKAAIQQKLARIERAEGHKAEIEAVRSAADKLTDRSLAYYYIRALSKLGEGKSTKFIFPMEFTNLAKALSGKDGTSTQGIESLLKKYAPLVKSIAEGKQTKPKKKRK